MISNIKPGTLWRNKKTSCIVLVLSAQRTGHQYDRYYEIESVDDAGAIMTLDDSDFMSKYVEVEKSLM